MDVLEELTEAEATIDKAYVERRVHDWQRRVELLYDDVLAWLPAGWSGSQSGSVPFYEEPMQRFGLGRAMLPVLVLRGGNILARLEPRGLWIIGANGRVDLISGSSHFLLVDRSENFQPSDWQVSSLGNRVHQRPLDRTLLAEMLV